jgi:hypothetical protein
MSIGLILRDDEDDPQGNVQHIVGTGEVTQEEVEEVLYDYEGPVDSSDSSGRPIVVGWTSTGKHIAVVFTFEDDPDLIIVTPITAFPVPEYGEGV